MTLKNKLEELRQERILVHAEDHVLFIGFNRAEKRNAADLQLLKELSAAYTLLDDHDELRVGVVYAVGDHFTAGLDLQDIAPRIGQNGIDIVEDGGVNPWRTGGRECTKPVVVAVQGICLTLGIELILAAEVAVASATTRFAQIEVGRAILPFGGATVRFQQRCGTGNAMRWILSGDFFEADEAHRIGLIQHLVPAGEELAKATEIARTIAKQAPLAVQATLKNSRLAERGETEKAFADLQPELVRLSQTEDSRIGFEAFLNRSEPDFVGR